MAILMPQDPDRAAGPMPVISIIIPVYNRQDYIGDCIRSIAAVGDLPAEIIVIDDGSADESVMRARAAIAETGLGDRARVVTQTNGGPGSARNHGASLARGEWLVFLDSDDLWQPWTVGILTANLAAADRSLEMCIFRIEEFSVPSDLEAFPNGEVHFIDHVSFLAAISDPRHLRLRYGSCNAAVRRRSFEEQGGFSTSLRCAEDTDLFLRVAGPTRIITEPVMAGLRRADHGSLSGHAPSVVEGFRWMAAANAGGRYRGDPEERKAFLASSCAYSIRMAFAAGWPLMAYDLYFRNIPLLFNRKTRRFLWRLPLTPVMHYRNPKSYPFKLRPS